VVLELGVEQERPADAKPRQRGGEQVVRVGHELRQGPGHVPRIPDGLAAELLLDDAQMLHLVVLRGAAVPEDLLRATDHVMVAVVALDAAVLTTLPGAIWDRSERLDDAHLGQGLLLAGKPVHAAEEQARARRVRVARARERRLLLAPEVECLVHEIPLGSR
jgi:hypothetical protein